MGKRLTRGRAIREKCLDCCCGQSNEVRLCETFDCTLWAYRLGTEDGSRYNEEDMVEFMRTRKKNENNFLDES